MAATFAHMNTISPPRLTRQFQLASDPGLHHPPVLCCRETNLLPSLNTFLLSLYEKYTLLCDLSSGNVAVAYPFLRVEEEQKRKLKSFQVMK